MGCITYVNDNNKQDIHSCQMCEDIPEVGTEIVIDGKDYVVVKVVPEISNSHKNCRVYLR